MNENEEQNEQQPTITDTMVLSYFDGNEPQQENPNKEQEEADALKLKEEQEAIQEQENKQKEADEQQKREEQAEQDKVKVEQQEADKPKNWKEGLDEKALFVLDKLSKGEDKDVYELLKNKYGYENLSEEQKALTYLQEKNPHLDQEDLEFKLAEEFGIGVTKLSQEDYDDLSDSQKAELKKQDIARKTLLNEATNFFKEKSSGVEIPSLPNPLDDDEGYKEYQNFKAQQEQERIANEEAMRKQEIEDKKLEETILSTAKGLDSLSIEMTLDLDQSEFALKSEFKLDDAKKKQLADYAFEYTPTKAEVDAHKNTNGEFDIKGYMTSLAKRLFSEQIQKSALKQAIVKDREEFTERELKNSTLRNNSNMQHADREEHFESVAMRQ